MVTEEVPPEEEYTPPPLDVAELPLRVELVTVTEARPSGVPEYTPPPLDVAELLLRVELVTVRAEERGVG
mgnify:CR=1 FL=1